MEQVREIDGEQAYEKMRRAMEKASQEKARQVERSSKLPVRKRPERRGPERSGPERDFGPAARSPFPPLWSVCFCVGSVLRAVLVGLRLSDEVRGDACGPAQERPLPSKGDDVSGQTGTRQKSRIRG